MKKTFLRFLNSDKIAGRLKGVLIKNIKFEDVENRKNILKVTITTDSPFNPFTTLGDLLERADIRQESLHFQEYGLTKLVFHIKLRNKNQMYLRN